ncbi:MAG: site-2 protease family protein [Gemmatimonadaceae bacterium]
MEDIIRKIAFIGPVLLFSVIAHEIAHGYAALRQGDSTALQLGRLSWNPIRHVDPFLTIILPVSLMIVGAPVLGGAKPVPVNPRNYRSFRRGDIIVSLAGVATNLVIALACFLLVIAVGITAALAPAMISGLAVLQAMLILGIWLNFLLIVFNLIPIPPLDGSHVMKYLLPPAWALKYVEHGRRFGFLILILLVVAGQGVLGRLLYPAIIAADALLHLAGGFVVPEAMEVFARTMS